MHLFSINDLIFETLQDKAPPKLMILIIFNILLSTKEPLKCPIMKFLVLGEIFRGKRKVPDEEELEREGEGERGRGVREREKYLMRRNSCGRGGGGGMEEQSWRKRRHGMQWHEGAKEARG
ncbi:hypothetical protein AMTRI_Chr02g263030 [Amborella trichopoda]